MIQSVNVVITMVFTALCLTTFSSFASADVIVERFTKSGGFGGMGASEMRTTESIKGVKKKEDSSTKFTGKFLGKFAGKKESSMIYRIDKDLIWDLDHSKKTYQERPISLPEGQGIPEGSGTRGEEPMEASKEGEEPEVRIVKNEFSVEKTGEKKTINGFPCEKYVLTWILETENVETKERSRNRMTTELWNTPKDKKIKTLIKEETAFSQAYLKKLGIDFTPGEMKQFGLSMLGSVAASTGADLKKEMSKIKGYPIVSSVKWEAESDKAKKEIDEEAPEDEGMDLSEGLGGFGSFLKKKMKGSKKEEKEAKPLFESYTEIKSIDVSELSDTYFNVPEGYRKK